MKDTFLWVGDGLMWLARLLAQYPEGDTVQLDELLRAMMAPSIGYSVFLAAWAIIVFGIVILRVRRAYAAGLLIRYTTIPPTASNNNNQSSEESYDKPLKRYIIMILLGYLVFACMYSSSLTASRPPVIVFDPRRSLMPASLASIPAGSSHGGSEYGLTGGDSTAATTAADSKYGGTWWYPNQADSRPDSPFLPIVWERLEEALVETVLLIKSRMAPPSPSIDNNNSSLVGMAWLDCLAGMAKSLKGFRGRAIRESYAFDPRTRVSILLAMMIGMGMVGMPPFPPRWFGSITFSLICCCLAGSLLMNGQAMNVALSWTTTCSPFAQPSNSGVKDYVIGDQIVGSESCAKLFAVAEKCRAGYFLSQAMASAGRPDLLGFRLNGNDNDISLTDSLRNNTIVADGGPDCRAWGTSISLAVEQVCVIGGEGVVRIVGSTFLMAALFTVILILMLMSFRPVPSATERSDYVLHSFLYPLNAGNVSVNVGETQDERLARIRATMPSLNPANRPRPRMQGDRVDIVVPGEA